MAKNSFLPEVTFKEFFPFSCVAIIIQRSLAILNSAVFWINFITQPISLFVTLPSVLRSTDTMCTFFRLQIFFISFLRSWYFLIFSCLLLWKWAQPAKCGSIYIRKIFSSQKFLRRESPRSYFCFYLTFAIKYYFYCRRSYKVEYICYGCELSAINGCRYL